MLPLPPQPRCRNQQQRQPMLRPRPLQKRAVEGRRSRPEAIEPALLPFRYDEGDYPALPLCFDPARSVLVTRAFLAPTGEAHDQVPVLARLCIFM